MVKNSQRVFYLSLLGTCPIQLSHNRDFPLSLLSGLCLVLCVQLNNCSHPLIGPICEVGPSMAHNTSTRMQRSLTPMLLLLLLLLTPATAFTFTYLSVGASPTTINTLANYAIYMNRGWYGGSQTTYSTPVPSGSSIVIQFPLNYALTGSYACSAMIATDSLTIPCTGTCLSSGNNLTLTGCFSADTPVKEIDLTISAVNNPSPALTTNSFKGWIGIDVSDTSPGDATLTLTPSTFSACSITFSPAIVNKTQTMVLSVTPKNQIPSTGSIRITFPSQGYWTGRSGSQTFGILGSMSCSGTSANLSPTFPCAGDTGNKWITASSLFLASTTDVFTFRIGSILAPPTPSNGDTLIITSYSGSNSIDMCSVSVTDLVANTLSISISANTTPTVNSVVSLTFNLVFSDTFISPTNTLLITFANVNDVSSIPKFNGQLGSANGVKSGTAVNVGFPNARTFASGDNLTFILQNYTIPPSTLQQSITVSVLTAGSGSAPIMTGTGTFSGSVSSLNFVVTPVSRVVSLVTQYNFDITLTNPLSSTGMIAITFPSQLGLTIVSSCATVSGSNVNSAGIVCTSAGQIVTISGFATGTVLGLVSFVVSGVTNAGSTAPIGSFSITTFYTNSPLSQVSTGTASSVAATAGAVSNVIVTPSSPVVKKSSVTYTISFKIAHSIPSGGSIYLGVPPAIPGPVPSSNINTQCFGGIDASLVPTICSATSSSSGTFINFTSLLGSSAATSGSTITLQISSSFTNPPSTAPVSSFSIETHDASGYMIDYLTTGISVSMTTAAPFNHITVSPVSAINSAVTTYSFTLNQPSPIDPSSLLVITYPPAIVPQSGSISCTDGYSTPLSCSATGQVVSITLPAVSASTAFVINVNGIKNPPSLKPTNPFQFLTTAVDGSLYSQDINNVIVTNVQASTLTLISGTFSSTIYGQSTALSISFTPTSTTVSQVVVTLSNTLGVTGSTCSSISGMTGTCTINSNVVTLTGVFLASPIGFTINGLTAPTASISSTTAVNTFNSDGYIIDTSSSITFTAACSLPCRTCFGSPSNCTSCFSNAAVSPNSYFVPNLNTCVINCQSGYFVNGTHCDPCSGVCKTCTGTTNNCTSCDITSPSKFFYTSSLIQTCYSLCPTYFFGDTQSYTCISCIFPCATCTSATQCLSCASTLKYWSGNNSCVATCPPSISIDGQTTCVPCSILCKTCQNIPSNCTSCADNAVMYQGLCLAKCPPGKVDVGGTCGECAPPCATCDTYATNCTSCITTSLTPLLLNNGCVAACPTTYYATSASGICISCTTIPNINCDHCYYNSVKLAVLCTSLCNLNYVYFGDNETCLASTPLGYVNILGIAQKCSAQCLECTGTQTTCSACLSPLSLDGSNCVSNCHDGTVSVNSICQSCNNLCQTCSGSINNCVTCRIGGSPSVYLNGNECTTNCPSTTYPDDATRTCASCVTPCATCTSKITCTSCSGTLNLNNGNCLVLCPAGTVGINNVCVACAAPCATCTATTTTCTSCKVDITQTYLNGIQCVSSCPNTTYPDGALLQCVPCVSPCSTCTTKTVCTSCSGALNLYNSGCIADCPTKFVASNNVCQPCTPPCATCTGTPTTCTSCITNNPQTYLSGNQCISICPNTTYPDDATKTCTTCVSNCATCSSMTTCTSCTGSLNLKSAACIVTCPAGFVAINNVCLGCSYPCATCSGTASICTSCLDESPKLYLNGIQCVSSCPNTTYPDGALLQCVPCVSPCSTCTTKTVCTSCSGALNLYNSGCIADCPTKFVASNNVCQPCTPPCATCTGTPTTCTSCITNNPQTYLNANLCSQSCPITTYPDDTVLQCTPCVSPCATCTSKFICTSCSGSVNLYGGTCVINCPSGYVAKNNVCQGCTYPCATCLGTVTNCTSCLTTNPHVYLNANQCTEACPTVTYPDDNTLTCLTCINHCATCTSSSHCLSCNSGYFFNNNVCSSGCPAGFVGVGSMCLECNSNCSTCTGSTTNCTTCAPTYYYVPSSFKCVLECPAGLYPYAVNMTCTGCISPCQTCTQIPTKCTSCIAGGLLGNQCWSPCPSTYFHNNGVCSSCKAGCATCTSASVCTSCSDGYHFYQSSCLSECPENAPVVSSNGSCAGCSTPSCARCTSTDSCFVCQGTKLVYSNTCVDQCPVNFRSNGTFCVEGEPAKSLSESLRENGVVPMPFSIATALIIIVCLFSKFSYEPTFFTGALYGLVGLIEPALHAYYIYLLWAASHEFNLMVILTMGALGCLYFVNLVSLIVVNISFCKDAQFKAWYNTPAGKCSFLTFCMLTVVFSFKSMNLIFSRLFNLPIFSAKMQHKSKLFCLHLMSFLGVAHSVWAIVMACFVLLSITNIATMLFFESIDLIIICSLQVLLGIFNARKDVDFFDEKDEHMSVGKKISISGDSMDSFGDGVRQEQIERGAGAKYQILRRPQKEVCQQISGFMDEENAGTNAMMPSLYKQKKDQLNKKRGNNYEELSERSNAPSIDDSARGVVDPLLKPTMNFREVSRELNMDSHSIGDENLNSDQNQKSERIGTMENLSKKRKTEENKDDEEFSEVFDLHTQKTPSKLKKSQSLAQHHAPQPINESSAEQQQSNQLMESNDKSEEFDGFEKNPMGLNLSPALKSAQSIQIKKSGIQSPSIRKRTLEEDVQEFEWDEGNNMGTAIYSPKKKPSSKLELGNEDIRNISGISEEGRENVMRLQSEMENRDIIEASNQEDPDTRKKSYESLEKSADDLEKSRELDKVELQMLENMGTQLFKKKKLSAHNTIFSNEKGEEFSQEQGSENRYRGSTFMKNSDTIDKSILESDDDIIHHPAYIKYRKAIGDTSKNYLSNQNLNSLDQSQHDPLDTFGNAHPFGLSEKAFPDELSRELYKYNTKEEKGRAESGKESDNWIVGNQRERFTSAGNRSIPFLRPIQLSRGSALPSEVPMSLDGHRSDTRHSLQKIPEGPSHNISPDTSMLRRPKYSSLKRIPKPPKDQRPNNKELERIYLGSKDK